MMSYATWNTHLFKHFFNRDNSEQPVILYVDRELLLKIGQTHGLGGIEDLVKSIVIPHDTPKHLVTRFNDLYCRYIQKNDKLSSPPDFFACICLSIMAWTIDPNLDGRTYYPRLNSLLQDAYREYYELLKTDAQWIDYNISQYKVGQHVSPQKDGVFRELLEKSFRALENHTFELLDAELGYFEFRRAGSRQISIPKAQALINARDKSGLERFFSEQGIQPEVELSPEEARRLLYPAALHSDYLTQATINRWNSNRDNQDIICEIVTSLVKHWDGTYVEILPAKRSGGSCSQRRSGAYLWPTLSVTAWGGYELGARIEFTNQDFPITPISLSDLSVGISIGRQHGGWSRSFSIPENNLKELLSSPYTKTMQSSDGNKVRFFPKPVFIFEKAPHLGGYTPAKDIDLNIRYLFFLNESEAATFVEANKERLEKLSLSPCVEGWGLYTSSEGLTSLEGLKNINIRPPSKVLDLFGGARIEHGSRRKFSAVVPPKVRLLAKIPNGYYIMCQHGLDVEEMHEREDSLFDIPEKLLGPGKFEVFISDNIGKKNIEYDSITFKLLACSMPVEGEAQRSNNAPIVSQSMDFLYNKDDFHLQFTGGTVLATMQNAFMQATVKDLPIVESSHKLTELSLFCDSVKLNTVIGGRACHYSLPSLEDGEHEIVAQWHGIEIASRGFRILSKPPVHVDVIGAIRGDHNGTTWLSKDTYKTKLKISITQQDGPNISIFLNDEKIESIQNGSYSVSLSLPTPGTTHLQLSWAGQILFENKYVTNFLPSILVALVQGTGKKWKGSQVYIPLAPPSFEMLIDNKDFFPLENLQCFLGDVVLYQESEDGEIIRYTLPQGHAARGMNMPFTARLCGNDLPLELSTTLNICDKPSCKIVVEGKELESGVYSQALAPRFRLAPGGTNLKLFIDSREIKPKPGGIYHCPPNLLSRTEKEKDITIQAQWWSEVIQERMIRLTRKGGYRIVFIGGVNISTKGNGIYLESACPTQTKIECTVPGSPFKVMYGQKGKEMAPLSGVEENLFTLGKYDAPPGSTHVVEIWQGDIKLHSSRFFVTGPEWLKLGYHEGQIAPLNSNVDWSPCWLVEKKGKKPPKLQFAGTCTEDMVTCPCENIKQREILVPPSTRQKKQWGKIVRRVHKGLSREDKALWNVFSSGRRS